VSNLDSLRKFVVVEGALEKSQTAKALHKQLSGFGPFKGWSEKKWYDFAQEVKSMDMLVQVFSGAFSAFIMWMYDNASKLPASSEYLMSTGLKSDRYDAKKIFGIMSGAGVFDTQEMSSRSAVAAGYSVSSSEKKNPKARVEIWTFGEGAAPFAKLLKKYGAGIKMKESAMPPFIRRWDE
jgi:hypothetical protein